jgi:hypothetical protein
VWQCKASRECIDPSCRHRWGAAVWQRKASRDCIDPSCRHRWGAALWQCKANWDRTLLNIIVNTYWLKQNKEAVGRQRSYSNNSHFFRNKNTSNISMDIMEIFEVNLSSFSVPLLSLEGQTGEAWVPYRKQCLFGNRGAIHREVYFQVVHPRFVCATKSSWKYRKVVNTQQNFVRYRYATIVDYMFRPFSIRPSSGLVWLTGPVLRDREPTSWLHSPHQITTEI